ncbi:MAG: hypothetical protein J5926_00510 [Ruminococcus sp.]|nr:hypothetical protein [Ruminococcus sp.]
MTVKTKHYKSKNEDSLSSVWVDVFLIAVFLFVTVIVDIKHKVSIIDGFKELFSINPFSALLLFLILDIVYLIIKSAVYNMRKKKIIESGKAAEGKITDTIYVNAFRYSPGPSYNYKYSVRLNDGRTVETEIYYEDFVSRDNIRNCTVYEYNGRCYFTDFH